MNNFAAKYELSDIFRYMAMSLSVGIARRNMIIIWLLLEKLPPKLTLHWMKRSVYSPLRKLAYLVTEFCIINYIPFTAEADDSGFTISETLNQNGRPETFHSKTLQANEQHHSPVGKEAQVMFRWKRKTIIKSEVRKPSLYHREKFVATLETRGKLLISHNGNNKHVCKQL